MYFGRLPFKTYDQYISLVSIINLPLFYFPYSTGVKDTKNDVPLLPYLDKTPYLGSTEN